MITDFVLSIPLFFVRAFVSFIPASDGLPAGVSSAISSAVSYMNGLSYFFPIDTFLTVTVLILSVEAGILLWNSINWILRKIPGVN